MTYMRPVFLIAFIKYWSWEQ